MTEEAKEARRAYSRKWAAEHRAQRKAANDRYWERRAAREQQEAQPLDVEADDKTTAE